MREFVLLLCFVLIGCQYREPLDETHRGKAQCANCKMNIVDYKFRSIIITEKGKIIPFDSIECLLGWGRIYRKKCQVFFSDFRAPDTLIVGKKAFILKSDKRPSPMGGGLSAYSTLESVLQAQRQVGGVRIEIK